MSVNSLKRKREKATKKKGVVALVSEDEIEKRMEIAKRFKQTIEKGTAVLDAHKAKPGTSALALIFRKYPTRSVKTALGGTVPSTGIVVMLGAFTTDVNVQDKIDPETGVVTLAGIIDRKTKQTKPTPLAPFSVITASMFRKLTGIEEGSVVRLYGIEARFWTGEDGKEIIFYGAEGIQTVIKSNDFSFCDSILRSMPGGLTKWMGPPERPNEEDLSRLRDDRQKKMDQKRNRNSNTSSNSNNNNSGGKANSNAASGGNPNLGRRKKSVARGGKTNFILNIGFVSEEEQHAEFGKPDGIVLATTFGRTQEEWFYRSPEVEQDLKNNNGSSPPLGMSAQDTIKMAIRLMICQWASDKGGFDKRVEFTARASFFSRMLKCYGIATPESWNVLSAYVPRLKTLVFMNEDRLETACMSYNDPEQRDPRDTKFGAHCFQMFVQNVWFDAVQEYSRVGIPVTLDFVASKLVSNYTPENKNLWINKPANGIDSTDLSKNVVCLNECPGDLQRFKKIVAVINYIADLKYQKETEEILRNLTAEEGARFLKMKESTSHRALEKLKKDFGENHPMIRLDGLLQRVNARDTELRCVFFAIPEMDEADKKKRGKAFAEFLGTEYQKEEKEKPKEEEEEKDVDGDVDMDASTPITKTSSSSFQSLDDDSDDDDDEDSDDDDAMMAAVIEAEQQQQQAKVTRRRAAPKKKASSSRKKKSSRRK